jgi:hypothetical protein
MTSRQVRQALFQLPEETQDDYDLYIKVGDQYHMVTGLVLDEPLASGALDRGSPVLLCTASDTKGVSEATMSILVAGKVPK